MKIIIDISENDYNALKKFEKEIKNIAGEYMADKTMEDHLSDRLEIAVLDGTLLDDIKHEIETLPNIVRINGCLYPRDNSDVLRILDKAYGSPA